MAQYFLRGIRGLVGRILPIIDYENKILANEEKPRLKLNNANIKFKNINFSYDKNKIILKNININIEGGKINAFVGLSGAGKSTLLNLSLIHISEPTRPY